MTMPNDLKRTFLVMAVVTGLCSTVAGPVFAESEKDDFLDESDRSFSAVSEISFLPETDRAFTLPKEPEFLPDKGIVGNEPDEPAIEPLRNKSQTPVAETKPTINVQLRHGKSGREFGPFELLNEKVWNIGSITFRVNEVSGSTYKLIHIDSKKVFGPFDAEDTLRPVVLGRAEFFHAKPSATLLHRQ